MTRRAYLEDHDGGGDEVGEDDIPRSAAIIGYVALAIVIVFLAWLFTVLFVLVFAP